eukprot:2393495-Pyramimonas_sp.AAC.1
MDISTRAVNQILPSLEEGAVGACADNLDADPQKLSLLVPLVGGLPQSQTLREFPPQCETVRPHTPCGASSTMPSAPRWAPSCKPSCPSGHISRSAPRASTLAHASAQ